MSFFSFLCRHRYVFLLLCQQYSQPDQSHLWRIQHTLNRLHCMWSRTAAPYDKCSAVCHVVALNSFCKEQAFPKARMHLSMDNMGIVDDSCLDNYDIAKVAGSSSGGRVHSIDIILGFAKDQDPLLHSVGDDESQKTKNMENPPQPEKQVMSDPYGHLPELGDSSQKSSYHGESFQKWNYRLSKKSLTVW